MNKLNQDQDPQNGFFEQDPLIYSFGIFVTELTVYVFHKKPEDSSPTSSPLSSLKYNQNKFDGSINNVWICMIFEEIRLFSCETFVLTKKVEFFRSIQTPKPF